MTFETNTAASSASPPTGPTGSGAGEDFSNVSAAIAAGTPATRSIRTFHNYLEAQSAVDYLSDSGFPVQNVDIIGRDIRLVESVSGRLTKGRAALAGAAGGAWFGLLVGLLLGLFLPGGVWLAAVPSAIVIGAAWGAVFGFVSHWATRGRRDFASTQRLEADRYDVVVDSAHADAAAGLLANRT